jgi:hypothetical protein
VCTRSPAKSAGAMLVGVCTFLGTLRGLKLIPSEQRCLVPPRRIELVEITIGYPYRVLRKREPLGSLFNFRGVLETICLIL